MNLTVESQSNDLVKVLASGNIRQKNLQSDAEPLAELLGGEDAYKSKTLLSFSDVEMIDSSGLGWLIKAHKRFSEAGGCLVLHSLPTLVLNVVKIVRLDEILHLSDNEQSAMQLANNPPAPPSGPRVSYKEPVEESGDEDAPAE